MLLNILSHDSLNLDMENNNNKPYILFLKYLKNCDIKSGISIMNAICFNKNLWQFKELMESLDEDDRMIFFEYALDRNLILIVFFIDLGVDLNAPLLDGFPAICLTDSPETLQLLLDFGVDSSGTITVKDTTVSAMEFFVKLKSLS